MVQTLSGLVLQDKCLIHPAHLIRGTVALGREGLPFAPTTAIISSSTPLYSSDISLEQLSTSSASPPLQPRCSRAETDQKGRRAASPHSSGSGSEFSNWTDTGDLAEQPADEGDPLEIKIRGSVDQGLVGKPSKSRANQSRRVPPQGSNSSPDHHAGLDKEDIHIPSPGKRQVSKAEQIIAFIMTGGGRQIHGLTGKGLLYFTSVFVSLGVFLFGYDQGVMSGVITGSHFKDYFNQPSRAEIGTMVAILEVGAFVASLVVGRVGDIIGRRKTIFYGSIIFFFGGALQTFANGMSMMLLGRIIAGVGVGALSTIIPVYQSEISPAHNRGKLACIEFSGNVLGYTASVWVDYFCYPIDNNYAWRIPLMMQCVMGALLGAGSLIICESPRWLLDNNYDDEGITVIADLYGEGDVHNPKAKEEFLEIKQNVLVQRAEGERSYRDMFRRYYKRVFIAMSAQAFAQLNGINVISYYAPLVFEQAGWRGRMAILMTGINGITYLMSTVPPWYLVDRWGRRNILMSGAIAMVFALCAISFFIHVEIDATPTMVVIFVMIYNAAFGYSWGPIPWLYPPEILPLSIRAKGASLSTAANWAFNWLVGEMTPVLQESIGSSLYLLHAFFCALSCIVETCGVRLEDMDHLFGDATNATPTLATEAERQPLSGLGSPSAFGNRRGTSSIIPRVDINPSALSSDNSNLQTPKREEGVGGWISRMLNRGKGVAGGSVEGGVYRQLDQEEN
ncbi:MAG: hypothetical protein M1829_000032 [Trizodia sp. TS-e1964]|nr:MAG: hypothetical protein M1829_000032 [Trizodia sp. TS-e1964]